MQENEEYKDLDFIRSMTLTDQYRKNKLISISNRVSINHNNNAHYSVKAGNSSYKGGLDFDFEEAAAAQSQKGEEKQQSDESPPEMAAKGVAKMKIEVDGGDERGVEEPFEG
jgi:hypothetical protein